MSQQLLSAIRRSSSSSSSSRHVAAAIVASATASVWVVRKTLCLDRDETPTIPPSVLSGNHNDTPAGTTTPANLSNARIRHHETTTLHRPRTRPLRPTPPKQEKKEEETVEPTKKTYDDLPPEDEPTHCSICMTNRLGPCRPYWRKLEHCMKDNSPSDDDGDNNNNNNDDDAVSASSSKSMEMCDEFFFPWLQCVQSHHHLYTTLMTNHVFQREYIHDLLQDSAKKNNGWIRAKKWEDPPVDWEPLWEYFRETGLTVGHFISGSSTTAEMQEVLGRLLQHGKLNLDRLLVGSAHVPEWSPDEPPGYQIDQTTGEELPLELVDLSVPVDLSAVGLEEEDGWEIDLAYASDEKGRVLGYEQFTKKPEEGEGSDTARLIFSVQPNRTRRIVLYKIFKRKLPQQQQQQQQQQGNDSEYEYFMYFSKSYELASEAYKAGIPP